MNWFKISIFSATCWNWITKFRNECEFALNWWHPTGSWIGMTKRVIYWILVQHWQCILGNCVLHPGLQKLLYLMSIVFYLSIVLWFYLLISIYSSIGHSVLYVFLSLYHAICHLIYNSYPVSRVIRFSTNEYMRSEKSQLHWLLEDNVCIMLVNTQKSLFRHGGPLMVSASLFRWEA